MIAQSEARRIASEWHGGQTSALYAFASSGSITPNLVHEIQIEINDCVMPGNLAELHALLEYVSAAGPKCQWPGCESHGTELASTVCGVERYCDYHLSEWEDVNVKMYLVKDESAGFPTYLKNATLVPDEETGTFQVEYERILALNAVTARALLDKPSVLTGKQAAFLRKEAGMSVARFLDLTLLTHWAVTKAEFEEKLPPYLDRLYRLHSGAKLGHSFYTSPLTGDDHALVVDLATLGYEWRLQVFPLTHKAGYHMAYFTDDAGYLCARCANDNEDQCTDPLKLGSGWPIVDGFSYLELEDGFTCAHCGGEYLW